MCRLRRVCRAAAVVVAATRLTDGQLLRVCTRRIVAVMRRCAPTAGMQRRGGGCQRERNEVSGKREQQYESGGQAMHCLFGEQNPKWNEHRTGMSAGATAGRFRDRSFTSDLACAREGMRWRSPLPVHGTRGKWGTRGEAGRSARPTQSCSTQSCPIQTSRSSSDYVAF